jgi:antibiotic biosynthesis monooxygenase
VGLDRRRAWIVLVASAALSAASARGGSAGRESERAILALERVWLDGYLARDASVFERLLDDDLSQVGLAGESARRRSAWRVIHLQVTPVPQSTSETRTLNGIRVLYRLRVKEEHEERFQDAWKRVTEAALRGAPGAPGSLLARTREASDVFLAVARWEVIDEVADIGRP